MFFLFFGGAALGLLPAQDTFGRCHLSQGSLCSGPAAEKQKESYELRLTLSTGHSKRGLKRADYRLIRRGWCLGREEFRNELLAAAAERAGPNHYGADRQETGEQKAQRIVIEELERCGWAQEDLQRTRKGDKRKVKIARRLRQETTMSLKWIAQRLQMGAWTYVSNLLREC